MGIPAVKKQVAAAAVPAAQVNKGTSEVVEEIATPAKRETVEFDLESWMAQPEELAVMELRVAHIVGQSGKDVYVGNHNGVSIFVNAQSGVEMPEIAVGKAAKVRISYAKHGGYKAEKDSKGITVSVFASEVALA